ncbi:hypothetical protein PBY51_011548 [Eleginops maclovinus]|uniref:Uncharacterized protein n=1 Tax=Eleginops maclovinus TaxID=56733 RepID=A0AAN7XU66_ELEMC|nr:hypothetical protein PBY51_011548 [Eleginops maclovinus]
MNPSGYPSENVPLQGGYEGFHGQPGVSTVVNFTTVDINTEPPKDHIIWSLCCLLYSNPFCLGLAAFIFSIKARDRKVVGDMVGARQHGSTARCLNIWATVLVSSFFVISFIIIIIITVKAARTIQTISNNRG